MLRELVNRYGAWVDEATDPNMDTWGCLGRAVTMFLVIITAIVLGGFLFLFVVGTVAHLVG